MRTGSRKQQWPRAWRARDGTGGRAPAGGRQPLRTGGDSIFGKEHAEVRSTDTVSGETAACKQSYSRGELKRQAGSRLQ